jgi:hypothetical protein
LNSKVFTVSQLPQAVDWLFRCGGTVTITLKNKPYFKDWDRMTPPKTCVGHVVTYFKNTLDVNATRYGHKEADIKIIIHEPSLDDLIADF